MGHCLMAFENRGVVGGITLRPVQNAVPPILYTLLALGTFRAAWAHPFSTAIGGETGDTFQNIWWLAWLAHAVQHGVNPLTTNYMDYPTGLNLMWNTSYPLVGLAMSPVTLALGPVFAFNATMTLAVILSAWSAWLLITRLTGHFVGALIGGLVYGFSPFMITQSLAHTQMTLVFMPPLIFLVLHEIVVRGRRRLLLGMLLGLLLAAQLLIGEEVLAITALGAVLFVVTGAAIEPDRMRERISELLPGGLVAGLTFAVAAAYPIYVQFFGSQRVQHATHPPNIYVSDAVSFLIPTQAQQFAPQQALAVTQRFSGNPFEWNSYLGLALLMLLGLIAYRQRRNPYIRVAASAAAVIAIWSLGVTVHIAGRDTHLPSFALSLVFLPGWRFLPVRVLVVTTFVGWAALWQLPLLDNLLPARLMLIAYLLIGVMLAIFVAAQAGRRRSAALITGALLAVVLIPLTPVLDFPAAPAAGPGFFQSPILSRIPEGSVALVVRIATQSHPQPLLWQANAGMRYRMNGGYAIVPAPPPNGVTFVPPHSAVGEAIAEAIAGRDPLASQVQRQAVSAELSAWHVRTVILGPMASQDRVRQMLASLIGGQPELDGGVWVWWDVA
ncbi:MAG: hypothetical protein ACR2MZ_03800 [Candidatus Dormibacter sp.]|uniref:hypothetical protein n=1 Tax=Candidatus Dormibacter sp. TaxID=2973982 RepID=UPI000DB04837|nr:MAG: hypothetical protein DLM66_14195 [Candidatus Dormibacteraeota bacterium]